MFLKEHFRKTTVVGKAFGYYTHVACTKFRTNICFFYMRSNCQYHILLLDNLFVQLIRKINAAKILFKDISILIRAYFQTNQNNYIT